MTFSGDSAFTTDRGLYAITSNVWPTNNKFKATFGIEDTMWVKFSEELDKNTDRIQWKFCDGVTRTLYGNGFYANAKAWVHKDTLFVKMDEKILLERTQGDSTGLNITVYAKNGLYAEDFELRTELVVPPQSSSSSDATSSSSEAEESSSSSTPESSSAA